jgi:hypothetical protein
MYSRVFSSLTLFFLSLDLSQWFGREFEEQNCSSLFAYKFLTAWNACLPPWVLDNFSKIKIT